MHISLAGLTLLFSLENLICVSSNGGNLPFLPRSIPHTIPPRMYSEDYAGPIYFEPGFFFLKFNLPCVTRTFN